MQARIQLWCAVVLGLAYLLPNHYSPWLSFHAEMASALAFAPVMVWAALRKGVVPALAYGAALLSTIPLLQWGAGQVYFAGDATMTWLYLAGFALALLAGTRTVQDTNPGTPPLVTLQALWVALLFSAVVSVGIAIHQWLNLSGLYLYIVELRPGARPFANLGQPNQFASLLLLGLTAVIFLFESRCVRSWVSVLAAAFLVFGLVMSGSRSALIAMVWFALAYIFMGKRCELRTSPAAIASLAIFYLGMSFLWTTLNQTLLLGVDPGSPIVRMETPGMRSDFWLSMLDAARRAPWAGYGWQQVAVAFNRIALDHPASGGFYDSAHNLLLDLVLQNGCPLGLLIIAGLVSWIVAQFRHCRDPLSWSVLMGVCFMINHAMFEYPLNYAYFLLPVGYLMGALSGVHPSLLDRLAKTDKQLSVTRGAATSVAVISLVLTGIILFEYPRYEADWSEMRFDEANIRNLHPTPPSSPWLLTQLTELIRFSRTTARPGMPAGDLEWMRRVSERYGYPSSLYRYALALALNGHPTEASNALRKLCSTNIAAVCRSAEKSWAADTQDTFPQLKATTFPTTH